MELLYQRFLSFKSTRHLIKTIEDYLTQNKSNQFIALLKNLKLNASLLSITLYRHFNYHIIYLLNDNMSKQDIGLELLSILSLDQVIIFDNQSSYLKECYRLSHTKHNYLIVLNNSDLFVKLPATEDWYK
ncbi:MAG: hypothetical protein N2748_00900, partial [candidate division WOR-3 bacterium]|nr:hypothetical protein [candidate division WOR-3 bacterium]